MCRGSERVGRFSIPASTRDITIVLPAPPPTEAIYFLGVKGAVASRLTEMLGLPQLNPKTQRRTAPISRVPSSQVWASC